MKKSAAKQKIPVENERARNRAVTVILSVTIALLLLGMLFLFLFPGWQARYRFGRAMDALREQEPTATRIVDLYIEAPAIDFRPITASILLEAEDDPAALREALLALEEALHYESRSKTAAGGMDLSLRFTLPEGDDLNFFLLSDRLYIRVGQANYFFAPDEDSAPAYAALEESVRTLLEEKLAAGER